MRRYEVTGRRVRYNENRSSVDDAKEIRRTFQDEEPRKQEMMRWEWPTEMIEVGTCEAVMYSSDKWRNDGEHVDYKHVAEGPQKLLVVPGFIRDFHSPRNELPVVGNVVEINEPMPDAFAKLARVLGLQAQLYREDEDGEFYLPNDDDSLYQINIAGAHLGAARHPDTGEKFLFVYTERNGVCALITGDVLDVEKDGIVG